MKEPKLRFKEFKDEWQPRKLSEFSEKINEKNESESYTSVLTNSAVYGVVNQQDFFKKDIANPENIERYTIVKDNDYMYNPRISKYAKFGPVNRNKLNATGIVSPMYLVFRTDNTVSLGFLDNYFFSSYWHKYVYSKGNTGARADRIAIKDSDFMNMEILMPSLKEQKKIAKFFADLDNQLELQSNKLETLKRDKKGYLQKMFPSDDSDTPKLRLKDFSDEWTARSLKNLSTSISGTSIETYFNDTGKYKVISIGSYGKDGLYIDQGLRTDKNKITENKIVPAGSIAMVLNDKTKGEILGKTLIVESDNEYIVNQRSQIIIPSDDVDVYFLNYYINSPFIHEEIMKKAQGGTQIYINYSSVENIKFKIPVLKEQQMIGMFFKNLDKQIELQQQKVTDLKNQKKAYLQKMFI